MPGLKPQTLPHDWFSKPLPHNVILGQKTWLYSTYAFRHYHSQQPVGLCVGNNTGIYNGTFFDLGPQGKVTIGNYATLVGALINTNQHIDIGDYVFIAHEVVLADTFASTPPHNPFPSPATAPPDLSIRIDQNAWIGARATLLAGAHIGEGAIVGAAAVIDFHVPPYTIAAGNPARIVRKIKT